MAAITILAILDPHVTWILPTKFRVNWPWGIEGVVFWSKLLMLYNRQCMKDTGWSQKLTQHIVLRWANKIGRWTYMLKGNNPRVKKFFFKSWTSSHHNGRIRLWTDQPTDWPTGVWLLYIPSQNLFASVQKLLTDYKKIYIQTTTMIP